MLQQYLILKKDEKEIVNSIKKTYKDVNIEKEDIVDVEKYTILSISYKGTNIDNAKKLSKIDEFMEQFSPTILENDVAVYFEEKLYPFFNIFERKLRKILYLVAAKNYGKSSELIDKPKEKNSAKKKDGNNIEKVKIAIENINGLEMFEFGDVFELLFVDKDMLNSVQTYIGENGRQLSKKELIEKVEQLNENTFWKTFLGDDTAITLQTMYNNVRYYRNDVMHAHNIRYDTYLNARKLVFNIISELDNAIDSLIIGSSMNVIDDFNDRIVLAAENIKPYNLLTANVHGITNGLYGFGYDPYKTQYTFNPGIITMNPNFLLRPAVENYDKEKSIILGVDNNGNVIKIKNDSNNKE